ncbi:AAA family ATPase [Actinocatenispora sera]|uniref:helix-turn-helix transcriptional regulator n=1 Tax=Actinocatenispora sera TaxID=390989 RepID=UPI0033E91B1D
MAAEAQRDHPVPAPSLFRPRFVGRRHELDALRAALAQPPAVVLVEGEAGIGKSRLVREFLAAQPDQRSVLVGGCPPFRAPYTLGPVVDAIRPAITDVARLRLSSLSGALRQLFPEWASALPPAPEPAEDAGAARHRLFRALVELMTAAGATTLVVEDVHWADEATLEFLLFLVSRSGMSLVVSYRPDDVPADSLLLRLSSWLPVGTARVRVSVAPLTVAETGALMSSMLSDEPMSASFAEFVRAHTDGVPLAIEESVRLMYERADLARRNGRWVRRHLADIAVPPTVRDAVLERIARLDADTVQALRGAAVLADPVDEATLATVLDLPVGRVRSGLVVAISAGLLQADQRGLVSFRHVLASRTVYEATPPPERRAMHLRAAREYEGRGQQSLAWLARLARHFGAAGETATWFHHAERAIDAALLAGDETTADTFLDDLIAYAASAAPDQVARLTSKTAFASFTGDDRYRRLVDTLCGVVDDPGLDTVARAEVRVELGRVLLHREDFERGYAELERAVADLPPTSPAATSAMSLLCLPRGTDRPADKERYWLDRLAAQLDDLPPVARFSVTADVALGLLMLGDREGWAVASRIPDAPPTSQLWPQIARVGINMGALALVWGHNEEARRRMTATLALTEQRQYHRYGGLARVNLAHIDWATGRWDGLAERTAAITVDPEVSRMSRIEAELVAGQLELVTGGPARAEPRLRGVVEQTAAASIYEAVEPAAALATLWLAVDRIDDALALSGETMAWVARCDNWIFASEIAPVRLDALLRADRHREATELVADFAAGMVGCPAPASRAALTRCRARLAEHRGELSRAAALYARASAGFAALPRPYDALLASESRARCQFAAGATQAGADLLAEVHEGFSALGALVPAARVGAELARRGAVPRRRGPGGRPSYGDRLSPRELQVVRLVVAGRTNRQIADALVLSRQTVGSHVRSVLRKLRVASRTAIAVRAVELGLLEGDE